MYSPAYRDDGSAFKKCQRGASRDTLLSEAHGLRNRSARYDNGACYKVLLGLAENGADALNPQHNQVEAGGKSQERIVRRLHD